MAVQDLYAMADSAAKDNSLDPYLVRGVLDTESRGVKDRANAESSKGAYGPMQLMPAAAEDMGVDRTDPAQNIQGGAAYLAKLKQQFGSDKLALMAYNWGPGNVRQWQANGAKPGDVPLETRNYLDRVQSYRATHAQAAQQQPATTTSPQASDAPKRSYDLTVDGVPFNVTIAGTREDAQRELQAALAANHDLLPRKAAEAGMKYDWNTGRVSQYGTIDKMLIGAGKVVHDSFTGMAQIIEKIDGNAQALQEMKDATDGERQLYNYLNKPGELDAADVGEVLAFAPMLWGGTGAVGLAARMGLIRGEMSTGNNESRLANAAEGVVEGGAGALGGLFGSIGLRQGYRLFRAIGASTLAKTAATAVADLMGTGGAVSGARVAGWALNAAKRLGEADTKVAGRGPNVYDRSGAAGEGVTGVDAPGGASAVGVASKFLSDVGHVMKDDVTSRIAELYAAATSTAEKDIYHNLLVQRFATAFGGDTSTDDDRRKK